MGVGNEPLRRQTRTPPITTRQARARDVQLTPHANRHLAQRAIKNVGLQIR